MRSSSRLTRPLNLPNLLNPLNLLSLFPLPSLLLLNPPRHPAARCPRLT